MGTFGEKFRKERERRGFTFDDVANVTKIGSRMLRAIEDEHFDQLPGGVFNKGFIRAYAKHLGLNDEEAVNEYLAVLREAQVRAQGYSESKLGPQASAQQKMQTASVSVPVEELPDLQLPKAEDVRPARLDPARSHSTTFPWKFVAITAVIVALGSALWNRHSRSGSPNTARVSAAPIVDSAAPAPAAPDTGLANRTTPTAAPAAVGKGNSQTASSPPSAVPTGKRLDMQEQDQGSGPPPAPSRPAALSLVIRASENSWISISADGQPVREETLIAPAHTSVRANREIVVKAGNAAAVSFLLNGKEIAAQGQPAEVRTYVFDVKGMHQPASGQAPDPQP